MDIFSSQSPKSATSLTIAFIIILNTYLVFIMPSPVINLLISFVAFSGFILAFFIHKKKSSQEKFFCPLQFNCSAIIHSEYSIFLGFPVEILGILYYDIVAVVYAAFLVLPFLIFPYTVLGMLFLTAVAFIFSLYLTYIQIFKLRQGCSWCLASTALSSLIFILVLLTLFI